ncbi:uncharacterized protein [Rutidosis leptorrhynchoides]
MMPNTWLDCVIEIVRFMVSGIFVLLRSSSCEMDIYEFFLQGLLYEMLRSAKRTDAKSNWKVLIMNKVTVKIMSCSCKMADITDGVSCKIGGRHKQEKTTTSYYGCGLLHSAYKRKKLIKNELPKNDYPCMNDPAPTFHGRSQCESARMADPPSAAPAHSMRSRRAATWARPRDSEDGYSSDSVLRHASSDFKKMGRRVFVFIVGGATRSELRVTS